MHQLPWAIGTQGIQYWQWMFSICWWWVSDLQNGLSYYSTVLPCYDFRFVSVPEKESFFHHHSILLWPPLWKEKKKEKKDGAKQQQNNSQLHKHTHTNVHFYLSRASWKKTEHGSHDSSTKDETHTNTHTHNRNANDDNIFAKKKKLTLHYSEPPLNNQTRTYQHNTLYLGHRNLA